MINPKKLNYSNRNKSEHNQRIQSYHSNSKSKKIKETSQIISKQRETSIWKDVRSKEKVLTRPIALASWPPARRSATSFLRYLTITCFFFRIISILHFMYFTECLLQPTKQNQFWIQEAINQIRKKRNPQPKLTICSRISNPKGYRTSFSCPLCSLRTQCEGKLAPTGELATEKKIIREIGCSPEDVRSLPACSCRRIQQEEKRLKGK